MATVHKRTTKSEGTKYDVRFRVGGLQRKQTFDTKRDADRFCSMVDTDSLRGVLIDPKKARTPFRQVAEDWLASNPRKRATSVDRDRGIIKHHLNPTLGDRRIGSISTATIKSLVNSWTQSASSVGRQYSCLRAIFSYAVDDRLIVASPCHGIKLPSVRLVERPYLDDKQLAKLAMELGDDQATFMYVGAVLGLRWGEVAGLTVGRATFGGVTVDRQLSRKGDLVPPKSTAGHRNLAVPDWLADMLKDLVAQRGVTDGDALLFVSKDDKPLDYTNWRQRVWVPACKRAGLEGLRFHDLRSLAATVLVDSGASVKVTQTRMGHANSRTTMELYARATTAGDRLAADAVGERMKPPTA